MRVLMLNFEFPPIGGGAANANYYLLKEFAKKDDISVDLITTSENNIFEVEQFSENIRVFRLNVGKKDLHYWRMPEILRWSYLAYNRSKKLISENSYDLIHCWFGWPSGVIGYFFRGKIPYIISLRGSDVPGFNPRLRILDRLFFSRISKVVWSNSSSVVANSGGLRELARKTLKRKIELVYNGVDTKEFEPTQNKKESKSIRLISVGRLIERKGYEYLVKALKGINHNITLTLIGDGNLKDHLRELSKKTSVSVEFKGALAHMEIARELQKADIFIMPSLNEGMSNSVLEAMACGLPIITTNVGGSSELIDGNGQVIEKADVNAIVSALERYLEDLSLMIKHGKRSREIIEKRFGWYKTGEQYISLYKNAVDTEENRF